MGVRDSFVTTRRAAVFCLRIRHLEASSDPISHTPRLIAVHHRVRHIGRRPAGPLRFVHPLPLGPPLEPRPFERTRKAHLAVAPHRQRHGASNASVIPRRSAGHRRASRPRLSPPTYRPTNRCHRKRWNSQCRGSDARHGSAYRATACDSVAGRPAAISRRAGTPRALRRTPPRRGQLHVRHIDLAFPRPNASSSVANVFDARRASACHLSLVFEMSCMPSVRESVPVVLDGAI
jgi:hypothetical protein